MKKRAGGGLPTDRNTPQPVPHRGSFHNKKASNAFAGGGPRAETPPRPRQSVSPHQLAERSPQNLLKECRENFGPLPGRGKTLPDPLTKSPSGPPSGGKNCRRRQRSKSVWSCSKQKPRICFQIRGQDDKLINNRLGRWLIASLQSCESAGRSLTLSGSHSLLSFGLEIRTVSNPWLQRFYTILLAENFCLTGWAKLRISFLS